jgi:hypothetical protein
MTSAPHLHGEGRMVSFHTFTPVSNEAYDKQVSNPSIGVDGKEHSHSKSEGWTTTAHAGCKAPGV